MKNKWRWAGVLTLAVILVSAIQFANVHAAIDLGSRCSLTIQTGTDRAEEALDLKNDEVTIDVYKVAGVVKKEGFDTYDYSEIASYSALMEKLSDTRSLNSAIWRELAQQAAAITFTSGQTIEKTATGIAGTAISDLDCGLYLVIAHGTGMEDYIETVTDETTGESRIVSIAKSKEYQFSFAPELISLPVTTADEITPETSMNTADASKEGGAWVYDAKAVLKYEYKRLYGDLEIIKNLKTRDAANSPIFVFDVEAELDGVNVYSDVVSLKFDGDQSSKKALLADKIPVGATVKVTEVYTGLSYELVSGEQTQTVVIPPSDNGDKASVSFTNDRKDNPPPPSGGDTGVVNNFRYETEGWQLNNTGDNSSQD